ncbi:MAG: hypothetical protein ACJ77A_02450 [Actinomycetota bacterium]
MRIGRLAVDAGKGAVAGAAGTAAITVSQMMEAKIRGREPSTSAAQAVENVLDVEPRYDKAEQRLNTVAHFGYGTAWGIPRGLLAAFGLGPVPATLLHFLGVQGAAMAVVPATTESPPVTEWPRREIAVETLHHIVYATVAGAVFSWLTRSERRANEPT